MRSAKRLLLYVMLAVIMCLALTGSKKKAKKPVETTGYDITIVNVGDITTRAATDPAATEETAPAPTEAQTTTAAQTTEAPTEPVTTKTPETTEAVTEPVTTRAPETTEAPTKAPETTAQPTAAVIDENGTYTSKEDVALYIHTYNKLPQNYITKAQAEDLGWISSKGNLKKVAPGKSIGGDRFGNYEGKLPKARGRSYTECDIDFDGGYRNSKRIIFSNDGLIFYTEDHYETFEQLY